MPGEMSQRLYAAKANTEDTLCHQEEVLDGLVQQIMGSLIPALADQQCWLLRSCDTVGGKPMEALMSQSQCARQPLFSRGMQRQRQWQGMGLGFHQAPWDIKASIELSPTALQLLK